MGVHEKRKQTKHRKLKNTNLLVLCHPLTSIRYYVGIGLFLFAFNHLGWMLLMLSTLLFQMIYFTGYWRTLQKVKFYAVIFLFIGTLNPFFVHRGKTILFYWMEKPMTLEAVFYGLYTGCFIISLLLLCDLLNEVLGTKKILYLLAKTMPQTAFMVGMTLRYTVTLKGKGHQYFKIQQSLHSSEKVRFLGKIKTFGQNFVGFSSAILEEGMVMSETLKAKAYGQGKRTSYQAYFFCFQDGLLLVMVAIVGLFIVILHGQGIGKIDYYRQFTMRWTDIRFLFVLGAFYGFFPFGMDIFYQIKRILNNGNH